MNNAGHALCSRPGWMKRAMLWRTRGLPDAEMAGWPPANRERVSKGAERGGSQQTGVSASTSFGIGHMKKRLSGRGLRPWSACWHNGAQHCIYCKHRWHSCSETTAVFPIPPKKSQKTEFKCNILILPYQTSCNKTLSKYIYFKVGI